MKRHALAIFFVMIVLIVSPAYLGAEDAEDSEKWIANFRVGFLLPPDNSDSVLTSEDVYFSVGALASFRLGSKDILKRLRFGLAFDYVPISTSGGRQGYGRRYTFYASPRMSHNGLFLFPHSSFDMVKGKNYNVFLHAGFAVIGEWRSLKMTDGQYGQYDLCNEKGYEGVCFSGWDTSPGFGGGVRYFFNKRFFMGGQFTHFLNGQNHLTIDIGSTF